MPSVLGAQKLGWKDQSISKLNFSEYLLGLFDKGLVFPLCASCQDVK